MQYCVMYEIPNGGGLKDFEIFKDINEAYAFITEANITKFIIVKGKEVARREND